MSVYIGLLRGINVGGKNLINMAELKKILEAMGLKKVKTYIQSGNVLFESDADEGTLRNQISNTIQDAFGFPVPVVLRTAEELEQIIQNCPFSEQEILEADSASDSESLYVALLSVIPEEKDLEKLRAYCNDEEEFRAIGRDIYLLFRNSIRNSKLANHLPKQEEGVTVRNWKTISKLNAMAKELSY